MINQPRQKMIYKLVSFYDLWNFLVQHHKIVFAPSVTWIFHYDGFYFRSWIFLHVLHSSSMSTNDIFLYKWHLYQFMSFFYFLQHIYFFIVFRFNSMNPYTINQHLIKSWLMVSSWNKTYSPSSSIFLFCFTNLSSNFL